jgi:excisionase family DNA binding protein
LGVTAPITEKWNSAERRSSCQWTVSNVLEAVGVVYTMIKSTVPFPYLTVYEVARATDLTVPCIYKHIHDGHIDVVKVSGFRQFMIEPSALNAFLKARANGIYVRPPKRLATVKEAE